MIIIVILRITIKFLRIIKSKLLVIGKAYLRFVRNKSIGQADM